MVLGAFLAVLDGGNQAGSKTFFCKSMGIWGSAVVQIETSLPEHCCSYGSKPGRFLGPFWLLLTAAIQAGPKNQNL